MRISILILAFILIMPGLTQAKKSKKAAAINPRLQNMTAEDQELFNSLTKSQQKNIQAGKVKTGYNAWMVTKALGAPYYQSENHPVYVDYEEVWLYTRNDIIENNTENEIIDPVTNWPTIHRKKHKKTCQVGDFFLLYDRGVVEKIVKDSSGKTYGSCTINTQEEFIPITKKKRRR